MKRRWLKWSVLSAVLGVAGFACYLWATCGSGGVNRMSVLRIRLGMNLDEVSAVIGVQDNIDKAWLGGDRRVHYWRGDDGAIVVFFHDDKVTARYFSPSSKSLFHGVYQWIGIERNEPIVLVE